jgi:hypothetical protein
VASANAASDVMAVVTTVAVAVVTGANTKAKTMKILRMIVPRFPRSLMPREPVTICDQHHEMVTLAERKEGCYQKQRRPPHGRLADQ